MNQSKIQEVLMSQTAEAISSFAEKVFTVKKFAKKNKEQGTWPDSEPAIWALRAGAPENGFGDSFITVGRRVLIVEKNFWRAVERLQESKNA